MKFLHIADLHIGKNLNAFSLLEDQEYILNQILDIIKEKQIDHLFISGDIYDRSIPSGDAVELFNNFLVKAIKEYNLYIYIIVGNHDSAERLNFVSELLKGEHLYICSYPTKELTKFEVNDEYGDVNIYMMPYSTPLFAKITYGADVANYPEMIKYYLDNTNIDYTKRNILLTHHTILHDNQCVKSDSEYNTMIGGTEGFESALINQFDYVACGHLHVNQYVGSPNIRYSGSILKYSLSEANSPKVAIMGELKGKGDLEINNIELKPLRDLKLISGDFDEIMKNMDEKDDDYIYFEFTNKKVITNGMQIIKTKYPHAVSLNYKNLEYISAKNIEADDNIKRLEPNEQFAVFYESLTGEPLNDYQKEVINDISGKE